MGEKSVDLFKIYEIQVHHLSLGYMRFDKSESLNERSRSSNPTCEVNLKERQLESTRTMLSEPQPMIGHAGRLRINLINQFTLIQFKILQKIDRTDFMLKWTNYVTRIKKQL